MYAFPSSEHHMHLRSASIITHIFARLAVACLAVMLCALLPEKAGAWDPDNPWTLPDTGQTSCYNAVGALIPCPSSGQAFHGQDANYEGSQPRYEQSTDSSGSVVAVLDLNTGLTWQYEDDGTQRSWADAGNYCDGLTLDDHADWRLPTAHELALIIDAGALGPACPAAFSCRNWEYWTSTEYSPNANFAWYVHFLLGKAFFFLVLPGFQWVRG